MSTAAPTEVIDAFLSEAGLLVERPNPATFVITLPGDAKLSTTVSLVVGDHALSINAFVARHPDENAEAVHT